MFQSNLEAFLYMLICFVYIFYQPEIRFIDFLSNASGISSWTWSPATRASFAGEPSDRMTLELANSMLSGNFCLAPKCPDSLGFCWAIIARSKSLRQEKLHSSRAGITNGHQPLTMGNTSRGTGECS